MENVGHISLFASRETICILDMWLKTEESGADLFDSNWLNRLCMDIKYLRHGESVKIENYLVTPLESLHDMRDNSLMFIINYNNRYIMYG